MRRSLLAVSLGLLLMAGLGPRCRLSGGRRQTLPVSTSEPRGIPSTRRRGSITPGRPRLGRRPDRFREAARHPRHEHTLQGGAQWRFSRVSYIQVGYEDVRREGQRIVEKDVVWGDTTYGAGGMLDGKFDSTEITSGTGTTRSRADNVRLGVTFGFSRWTLDTSLSGRARSRRGRDDHERPV